MIISGSSDSAKVGESSAFFLRFQTKSFMNYQLTFVFGGMSVRIAIAYRLNPTKTNVRKAADFFNEFSEFVHSVAINSGRLLILGAFIMDWICQRDGDMKQLDDILRPANLRQHVQERTHRYAHIVDVISRDYDYLIKGVSVSSMESDHFFINIDVSFH